MPGRVLKGTSNDQEGTTDRIYLQTSVIDTNPRPRGTTEGRREDRKSRATLRESSYHHFGSKTRTDVKGCVPVL